MSEHVAFIDLAAQEARIRRQIDAAIARVLDHGAFVMGPEVAELEDRLAVHSGAKHVVTCSNGTDAIVLALRALGIGPGDAVLLPAFTFAASAGAVAMTGATPVFLDCLEDTFNIDPAAIEGGVDAAQRARLRPRAVLPVDLFGQPADHDAVAANARAQGLDVVVDAAQSYGSTWQGRRAGTVGRLATTSFFPAKPLGCYGDGGAVFTDDDELAVTLRSLHVHGQGAHKYSNVRVGMNARLDTIQAAILLEKLAIFDEELGRRQQVAQRYAELLDGVADVPVVVPGARSSWAQYTVKVPQRDAVAAALRDRGIPTAVYYVTPLHHQDAFSRCPVAGGELPVSDALSHVVLSLPMHPYLDHATQDHIAQAVRVAVSEET